MRINDIIEEKFAAWIDEEDDAIESFGFGVYHYKIGGKVFYCTIGADDGVGFFSGYYPEAKVVISSFCNTGYTGSQLLFSALTVIG